MAPMFTASEQNVMRIGTDGGAPRPTEYPDASAPSITPSCAGVVKPPNCTPSGSDCKQGWLSISGISQLAPMSAGRNTWRVRVREPRPHTPLHADHSLHAPPVQFCGQLLSTEHRNDSRNAPQVPEPTGGFSMTRVRVVLPPVHEKQGDQLDHSVSVQFWLHCCVLQVTTSVGRPQSAVDKRLFMLQGAKR